MRQGSVAKTPDFLETISPGGLITGESGRSGRNSRSDGIAKKTTIQNEFRESSDSDSRIEIRADNGGFGGLRMFPQPLLCREMLRARSHLLRGLSLSGGDSRRILRFSAWYGLRCMLNLAILARCQERFPRKCTNRVPDSRTGLKMANPRTILEESML